MYSICHFVLFTLHFIDEFPMLVSYMYIVVAIMMHETKQEIAPMQKLFFGRFIQLTCLEKKPNAVTTYWVAVY